MYNKGDYSEVVFECDDGTKFTEIHTIQNVENEHGERIEPNQSSYCVCDNEFFNVIWSGKTHESELEFVGECGNCGREYSDIYKYSTTN